MKNKKKERTGMGGIGEGSRSVIPLQKNRPAIHQATTSCCILVDVR